MQVESPVFRPTAEIAWTPSERRGEVWEILSGEWSFLIVDCQWLLERFASDRGLG